MGAPISTRWRPLRFTFSPAPRRISIPTRWPSSASTSTQHRRSSAIGGQSWRISIRCCQKRWPRTLLTGSTGPASSPPNSVSGPISTQKVITPTAAGITVKATRAGAQTQVAVSRPHGKSAEQGSPSDAEPPTAAPTKKRRGRRLILVGAAAAVVVVAAISATIYVTERKGNSTTAPAAAAPPLDGTYRIDIDRTKQTVMGVPNPAETPRLGHLLGGLPVIVHIHGMRCYRHRVGRA